MVERGHASHTSLYYSEPPFVFYYPNPLSYILSADQTHKAESLRKGIEASKRIYANAPEEKRKAWEKNFLVPFERKLKRKEAKK